MVRARRWLTAGILCASFLPGCSSAIATNPLRAPSAPTEGPKVVLRVGTGDSGAGLEPHHQIISQFEKLNPDIKINVEPVAGSNYYDVLEKQINDGDAPDIMQIGDDAVPRFVRMGAFVDLGPYIGGANPLDKSIYLAGVFEPGAWQGKQYFLPKDFSPLAVYYNKKIFDRAGVPYPRDGWFWNDFLATAEALTLDANHDGKPETWGVQLPATWTGGFEYWVGAAGATLIGEDGKHIQGYMDSPEVISALTFYASLYRQHRVAPPPVGLSIFQGGNQDFVRGDAAMLISGHWPESDLMNNPAIDLGVVGMPVGKQRANVLFWSGFGIFSGSRNKDEAWRFLRYYAGREGAQVWKDWGLPTVKSVAESSGMTGHPLESVWLKELAYLVPRAYIFSPYWSEAADPVLRTVLERALTDSTFNPGALLKEGAIQAQTALDKLN